LEKKFGKFPSEAQSSLLPIVFARISLVLHLRLTYHRSMARGWESKSVEEQQSLGGTETAVVSENQRQDRLELATRERQKQELELQRERILSQRTSSPVRRAALEAALTDIQSRLNLLEKA
jgi:hypothetical protein